MSANPHREPSTPFLYPPNEDPDDTVFRSLTVTEARRLELHRVGIRVLLGMTNEQGIRANARANGLRASSLSKVVRQLAKRLGIEWSLVSEHARAAWREAAIRRCEKEKAARAGNALTAGNQENTPTADAPPSK